MQRRGNQRRKDRPESADRSDQMRASRILSIEARFIMASMSP
jgi:hypothetical protein